METVDVAAKFQSAPPMWVQTVEDVGSSIRAFADSLNTGPVLCIVSGGCTPMGLLRGGAEHVIAVDINPSQLDVLRLKLGGLQSLEPEPFLELFLSRLRERRLELYQRVRDSTPDIGGSFDGWLSQIPDGVELVDAGVMQGTGSELRQEQPEVYRVLWDWIAGEASVPRSALLAAAKDLAARFQARAARLFPAGSPLPPGLEQGMENHIVARFSVLLNELPTHGNPYLAHTMLGTYPETALPEYFQASSRDALRGAHSKVDLVRSDLVDAVEGLDEACLAGADISNVGDAFSPSQWDRLCVALHRSLRPRAAVVHRSLIRDRPHRVPDGFVRDEALSSFLYRRDRSFIYRNITVDRRQP